MTKINAPRAPRAPKAPKAELIAAVAALIQIGATPAVATIRESRSVVPQSYRALYKAQGDATSCGDWLANLLKAETHELDEDGKPAVNLDRFIGLCAENGVDCSPWAAKRTPGWEGRLRMTARNVLARKIAKTGVMLVDGATAEAPAEFRARWTPKPR